MLATRLVARHTLSTDIRGRTAGITILCHFRGRRFHPQKGHQHVSLATMSTSETGREMSLQNIWAEAYDAWIDVPGETGTRVVYAQPVSREFGAGGRVDDHENNSQPFPRILTSSVSFALTGFNKMGVHTSIETNKAANDALFGELRGLKSPKPIATWRSFGFSTDWREDGFVVAYAFEDGDVAREQIKRLAVKYEQGAIYEYAPVALPVPVPVDAGDVPTQHVSLEIKKAIHETVGISQTILLRKTIPAAMSHAVEADVLLRRCPKPEGLELAELDIPDDAYAQQSV